MPISQYDLSNYPKRDEWHKAMLDQGHTPKLIDDLGVLDMFGFSERNHNGPMCTKCGWHRCWHCEGDVTTMPKCIDTSDIPEVGPEWFEKAVLSVVPSAGIKGKRTRKRKKKE